MLLAVEKKNAHIKGILIRKQVYYKKLYNLLN